MPVVWVVGDASLVVVNASGASGQRLGGSNGSDGLGNLGLSLVPCAATEAAVVGVKARLPVVWVVGNAGLVSGDARAAGGHSDGLVSP